MSKNYVIEEDLIELSGEEGIKRLVNKENIVHVDIDLIETRADNTRDIHQAQFIEALNFINSGKLNNGHRDHPKGRIHLGLPDEKDIKNTTYLTKKKGKKSNLERRGIKTEDPKYLKFGAEVFDEGLIDLIYTGKSANNPAISELEDIAQREFFNNQMIRLNNSDDLIYRASYQLNSTSNHVDRFRIDEEIACYLDKINLNQNSNCKISGFVPRNLEQQLGMSLLTNKNIELHFIDGGSGSGKTVLGYAAALSQILSENGKQKNAYEGIILFKSNDIIGGKNRELGFLPGTAFEKVKPFMKSYMDAHRLIGLSGDIAFSELLATPNEKENDEFGTRKQHTMLGLNLPIRNRAIEIENLQFARGRTFENQLIIVDEAQNYSPFEIKQLIERSGDGCKIMLVGDPQQIDNPALSSDFNGFTFAAQTNLQYGHPRMSITKLNQNYRSQSAEIMRRINAPGA